MHRGDCFVHQKLQLLHWFRAYFLSATNTRLLQRLQTIRVNQVFSRSNLRSDRITLGLAIVLLSVLTSSIVAIRPQ